MVYENGERMETEKPDEERREETSETNETNNKKGKTDRQTDRILQRDTTEV
jgi:hypothetical protein